MRLVRPQLPSQCALISWCALSSAPGCALSSAPGAPSAPLLVRPQLRSWCALSSAPGAPSAPLLVCPQLRSGCALSSARGAPSAPLGVIALQLRSGVRPSAPLGVRPQLRLGGAPSAQLRVLILQCESTYVSTSHRKFPNATASRMRRRQGAHGDVRLVLLRDPPSSVGSTFPNKASVCRSTTVMPSLPWEHTPGGGKGELGLPRARQRTIVMRHRQRAIVIRGARRGCTFCNLCVAQRQGAVTDGGAHGACFQGKCHLIFRAVS